MGIVNRVVVPIIGCGSIGIVMCMILYEMYARGIIIDEFITGSITINDLATGVMFLWLVIALIIAAARG